MLKNLFPVQFTSKPKTNSKEFSTIQSTLICFLHSLCTESEDTKKVKLTMICRKAQFTAIYREKVCHETLNPGPGYREEPIALSQAEIQTGQINFCLNLYFKNIINTEIRN